VKNEQRKKRNKAMNLPIDTSIRSWNGKN